MKPRSAFVLLLGIAASGCHSHVITVDLVNISEQPVNTIVVDYPGATFGINSLAPGKTFHYAIKPLDNGRLKIQFSDAHGGNHTYAGPNLQKNQEGSIKVSLTQDSASAEAKLM